MVRADDDAMMIFKEGGGWVVRADDDGIKKINIAAEGGEIFEIWNVVAKKSLEIIKSNQLRRATPRERLLPKHQ